MRYDIHKCKEELELVVNFQRLDTLDRAEDGLVSLQGGRSSGIKSRHRFRGNVLPTAGGLWNC
jgi:hypothetical protein